MLAQVVRFAVVGVAATLTHVGTAMLAVEVVGIAPLWANCIGFCLAVVVSYIGHHRWTFATGTSHTHSVPRFLLVALLGLAASQGLFAQVHLGWGFDYRLALLVVVIVVPAFTYLVNRGWTFREPA